VITRRLAFAFIIALLVSGAFTFWLNQKFSKTKTPPPPPKSQYAAAAANLEAGQALRADNLRLVDWPANVPINGAFTTVESLVGRVVLYPLAAGEPILERQLSSPGAAGGLTVKIPEGMRAISLRCDEVVCVAGFLLPGTRVDVLVTLRTSSTPEPVTSTVLQDVEVLAAGQKTQPDPDGKASTVTAVTLLVKPEDAERVVLASTQGSLHFILRNGSDRASLADPAVQLSQLSGAAPIAAATGATVHRHVQPAVLKTYSVQTTLGTKERTDSFNEFSKLLQP
jgi:pilus assembly protein CpaB